MAERRIVRVVANDKRYTKSSYPSVAVYRDDWGTFITGQHIDPNDPNTNGNLTLAQMRGLDPLTDAQKKKFGGYVINPDNQLNIKHNWKLDITVEGGYPVNAKDYWDFNYLKHQEVVAARKEEYNKQTNRFYLEDKEADAVAKISKRQLVYKAVEKVRANLAIEKLTNIAIQLNYYNPKFNVNPSKISKTILEDMIYDECENHPDYVLKCFEEGSEAKLYILQLAEKGVLKRRGEDFFDGSTFVGQGIDNVIKYMNKEENRQAVNKWASLHKGDHITVTNKSDNTDRGLNVLAEGLQAVISQDKAKVAHCKMQLQNMKCNAELERLLEAEKALAPKEEPTEEKKEDKEKTFADVVSERFGGRIYAALNKEEKEEYQALKATFDNK